MSGEVRPPTLVLQPSVRARTADLPCPIHTSYPGALHTSYRVQVQVPRSMCNVYAYRYCIDQNEDTLSRDIVPIQFDTQGSWLGTDANGGRSNVWDSLSEMVR